MVAAIWQSVEKYPRLTDIIEVWAEEKADKVCLLEIDGRSYTYAQLNKEINSLAAGLHKIGVSKDDTVLTMLENSMECVEAWLAVQKLGAIEVPVHTAYKGYFIRHILNTCNSKVMFVHVQHLNTVLESLGETNGLKLIVVGGETVDHDKVPSGIEILFYNDLKIQNPQLPKVACSPDDIAYILFTSGTKSGTKGLTLTHRLSRNQGLGTVSYLKLTEDDISYVCFPMAHGNGKFGHTAVPLMIGATSVIDLKFSASKWIHNVHKFNITYTSLMGPMAEFVYNQPPTEYDRNNRLRVILNIPRHKDFTPKFEERFGVDCVEVFGQAGMVSPINAPFGKDKIYSSCGRLREDIWEARLVDPVTKTDVKVNETGELWLRPKKEGLITPGYYNDPDSFNLAWRDGWYMSGDLLKVDENGNYSYMGRTGEFIRRRGENVSTQEVEMVLKSAPSVRDAAVIGVPTEFAAGEDDIMAVIEGEGIDLDQLIEHAVKELPVFAVPRYWLVDPLPRLPDQTIDKQALHKRGVTPETFDRTKTN